MSITLPSQPKIIFEEENKAVFEIEGLYPGYGQTIGNSLRRVLISSLRGAAITSLKIEGVGHEFSTVEGVAEDVVELLLNFKQVRLRLHEDGPFTITLSVKGEREVTAGDFKTPSQVEVVNQDLHLATLTSKKSNLEITAVVESGFGYVPAEARSKERVEVGMVALDAAFSPVRHVNYEVENMRVGDRTDYNLLRFHIDTDGSITPKEAFKQAVEILREQFGVLATGFGEVKTKLIHEAETVSQVDKKNEEEELLAKIKLDDLKFSNRTLNALREAGIKTVGRLSRKKESTLREIEGIGEKGIQEIKKALGNFGITLKQ